MAPLSVMLCGLDLPRVDIILISRPFSHLSSILQAGGRGGRLMKDGTRRKVVVFLLFNATDIRPKAKHIAQEVRDLYRSNLCIKRNLHSYFSASSDDIVISDDSWCCDLHN